MDRIDPVAVDGQIVELHEADAADGLRLSTAAGWNQTIEDWRLLLQLGRGFGLRTTTGLLVASSIALPYAPGFGWIGMLLVDASCRRQGHASRLLLRTIDQLRSMGLVPVLDATPAGKLVYERLGFVEVEGISRWRRQGTSREMRSDATGDLSAVLELDREAFGADRSPLLRAFAARPGSAVLVDPERGGYSMSRQGRTAKYLGPIVSRDPARRGAMVAAMLATTEGPVVADIPDTATSVRDVMVTAGFEIERPLTRMALGRTHAFGVPEMVAAIAGPEFG